MCTSSGLSKLPPNVTAWGNMRGGSREGRHLPPQDSPLRTSWSIPWALSRHSYEESHQQKFYWIYCYRSWILSAKSRRRKFSQKDNKVGCFYHFTLNHEQWALAGSGGELQPWSLPAMKGKHVPSSEVQYSLFFRGPGPVFWGHWLILHWNLMKLQGVEWAGTASALPVPFQTPLLNQKNSTKSTTKSLRTTTPKLTLLCTEPAHGNLSKRQFLEIKFTLEFCILTSALKTWI